MKTIIIAAGYATRLYPLTENFPKPLLEIGNNTILGRLVEEIDKLPIITEYIIVTNHKFVNFFTQWAANAKTTSPIRIVDDGTTSNDKRLGAVKDMMLAIDSVQGDDDFLVAAADNVLDFPIKGFVDFFQKKGASVIMCHREQSLEKLRRTGVIEVDSDMRVLQMQEKPNKPISTWAVPPFYIYKKEDIGLLRKCIEQGCNTDAPGNLLQTVCRQTKIYAWEMTGKRYDIGNIQSYNETKQIFG